MLLAGHARGDTLSDNFSAGLRPELWTVVQTTPGQFGFDDTQGDVRFQRISPSTPGGLQNIAADFNLGFFGGPVPGDFDVQVDFHDASLLTGGGLNQVELHATFADGQYLFVVYDNDGGANLNFHVWNGSYHNQIRTSATSGTMRISRTGDLVTGFTGGTPIFSMQETSGLTAVQFVLQNNLGSAAPISVTFDNFSMTAEVPCRADLNQDGFLNSQDFFDFLAAFFALQPAADFNHDTFINSQDFFDFLAAFFAGC